MTSYVRISTPSRSAIARVSAFGRTLNPTTIPFDAAARLMSFSVIPPTPEWMTFTRTSACWILASSLTIASTEPCTSPLTTMFRSWTSPAWRCSNRFSSVMPDVGRVANCSRRRRSARFCARSRASRSFSTTRASSPAGGGLSKPRISTGSPGPRVAQLVALVVVERAHLAPGVAGDDRVADLERAALHEHRRDRAAADVEPRLDDRPGGLGVRVRLQLELGVGDEQHLLEQLVEAGLLPAPRRARSACRRPTPRAGGPRRRARRARGRGWRRAGRSC